MRYKSASDTRARFSYSGRAQPPEISLAAKIPDGEYAGRMEIEPIKPPFTHERVWEWCAHAGELAVEEHLNGEDHTRTWNNADLRKHARAWLRRQQWDRVRAAEALTKRVGQAAWFAAVAAAVSAVAALITIYLSMTQGGL
jgi:hypothetical protein